MLKMDKAEYEMLTEVADNLIEIVKNGQKTVEMLLMSLKTKIMADDVKKYSISRCIKEALSEYHMQGTQKRRINFKEGNDFKFLGSKHFLKHVIFNLIQNTFKYAGKNAAIEIWLENNRIYFKDNGSGIDPEKLPHIFENFHTASSSGTGLGLAFCKRVMESFVGEITCKSEVDQYTEFCLSFHVEDFT